MARTTLFRLNRGGALLVIFAVLLCVASRVEHSARAADRIVLAVFVAKDAPVQGVKMTELRR
ncbi:MAG: hypothetical protein ABIQ16_21810, partial [Polyangiaceae bacterium]